MKLRITASLLAAALITASLAGCGSQQSSSVPVSSVQPLSSSAAGETAAQLLYSGTAVNACIGPEPQSLDPALSTGADTDSYCAAAFEGLYKINATGQIVLGQAEKVSISADKKTWTFTLRPNIKWSDGKAVTADDFVFAWHRNIAMQNAQKRGLFAHLKNGSAILDGAMDVSALGVSAPTSRTLVVALNAPCDFLPQLLVQPIFMPLREDKVGKNDWDRNSSSFVCNGPMKMIGWNVKSNIIYERSDQYYQADKVTASRLTCTLSEDDEARFSAYDNNETEYISPLPVKYFTRIRERGDYLASNSANLLCLQLSTKDAPLSDIQIRKALSLAINRDNLAVAMTGIRFQAADAFVPHGFADVGGKNDFRTAGGSYFATAATDYKFSVGRAQMLLAQAGYPGGKGFPQITISVPMSTLYSTTANAVAGMWKAKLGINCKVEQFEYKNYQDKYQKGSLQATISELTPAYQNAAAILEQFLPGRQMNPTNWDNSKFTQQMTKAFQTDTQSAGYCQALHAAEKVLAEHVPAVPLLFVPSMSLRDSKLGGVFTAENGMTFFAYANKFNG